MTGKANIASLYIGNSMQIFDKSLQKGQALLIVVLVMVVALTVALSVVSRSIVNLKTSTQQTESQKALAAAEASVEKAIKSKASTGTTVSVSLNNVIANATPVDLKINSSTNNSFLIHGGNLLEREDGGYVWLAKYPITSSSQTWPTSGSQNLTFFWGDNTGGDNNAALEIVLVWNNSGSPTVTKYNVDPSSTRRGTNNFATPATATTNQTNPSLAQPSNCLLNSTNLKGKYTYSYTIPAISAATGGYIIRVMPFYKSAKVAVCDTSFSLPNQGQVITSSATAGSVQRSVTVFQGYPELPAELFPYGLVAF